MVVLNKIPDFIISPFINFNEVLFTKFLELGYLICDNQDGKICIYSSKNYNLLKILEFEDLEGLNPYYFFDENNIYIRHNCKISILETNKLELIPFFNASPGKYVNLIDKDNLLIVNKDDSFTLIQSSSNRVIIQFSDSFLLYYDNEYLLLENYEQNRIIKCQGLQENHEIIWEMEFGAYLGTARFIQRWHDTIIITYKETFRGKIELKCLDLKSGNLIWKVDNGVNKYLSYNGLLVGSGGRFIQIIEPSTGRKIFEREFEQNLFLNLQGFYASIYKNHYYVTSKDSVIRFCLDKMEIDFILRVNINFEEYSTFLQYVYVFEKKLFVTVGGNSLYIWNLDDMMTNDLNC